MSLRSLLTLPLALLMSCAQGEGLPNPDFENWQEGDGPPEGWAIDPASAEAGYTLDLVTENTYSGERCALLVGDEDTKPMGFGNVMQKLDATPYRGKILRFTGAVRMEAGSDTGSAHLWFRVDRPRKRMGFFDNMMDRPIHNSEWSEYVIEGPVATDAEEIALGCMLQGRGQVWIDATSLEVVGEFEPGAYQPAPSRTLSARELDNLRSFARLYGYLRYFHPSEEAEAADWEDLARQGVAAVEFAKDESELAGILRELFLPLAPTLAVYCGEAPPTHEALQPTAGKDPYVLHWEHVGVASSWSRSMYTSERKLRRLSKLPAELTIEPLRLTLGTDLHCELPVVLPTRRGKSKPLAEATARNFLGRPAQYTHDGDDRITRLANLIMAWNVFQHFYPYFDVTEVDWSAALDTGLQDAAEDGTAEEFLVTLKTLVGLLGDGHGRVNLGGGPRQGALPLNWAWIEGRLVVTGVAPDVEAIRTGEVVLGIDGRSPANWRTELAPCISAATPGWPDDRLATELSMGPEGKEMKLTVETVTGETREVTLSFDRANLWQKDIAGSKPEQVTEIEPGILYLDLDRIEDADLEAAMPRIAAAKGLVLDMRGYPGGPGIGLLGHLSDSTMTCAQWHIPQQNLPDRRHMKFNFSNWDVEPAQPRIEAPCAFIIDGRAISYAETCMGIVEHYGLGELVGSPTAGTNGNVNRIDLPGNYFITWTGMKVLKHDGSRHHGVGILPTLPVERSIAGVREGKDELLEAALKSVRIRQAADR